MGTKCQIQSTSGSFADKSVKPLISRKEKPHLKGYFMQINAKDVASGSFFTAVGLAYFVFTWVGLPIGSALDMGPGYFPIVLSSILMMFGVVIAFRGFRSTGGTEFGRVPWRAVFMLSIATLLFAMFFDNLGLLPGVFMLCVLSALASSKNSILKAVIVSAVISVFCTAVFGYGIGLPVPIIGPLFNF